MLEDGFADFFGVAEEHGGIGLEEKLVLHASVARSHGALDKVNVAGVGDVEDGHAVDRALFVGFRRWVGYVVGADDEGSDAAGMTRSIPMEKALDDAMIVYAQNGERLRPEQGYPVRLLNPGWEGNTSVKWLRRLKVGDMPWHHREETSKYTDLMADGRARRFTWVMDANSVITYPCPEKPLLTRGKHTIGGLAWSGRGRIKRVDVSTDGGVNWQTAKITSEVLPKALTRFELELDWQGQPLLLQSRAMDETGYVQPTLAQLRAVRGVQSIYHKNSIQTWQVDTNGGVANVQIS